MGSMSSDDVRPGHAALQRLLVPIDGASCRGGALPLAIGLARRLGARVTLLGIARPVEPPPRMTAVSAYGVPVPAGDEQELLDRLAREQVDEAADGFPAGVDVRKQVVTGPAGPAIVAEVSSGEHDLVVLAWHGSGRLGHLFHDHVAYYVLAHCPAPVVVVPATDRAVTQLARRRSA
jgi:nucleotide-binding universal stress UspA family protein